MRQISGTVRVFVKIYEEMREKNLIGSDKQYHCQANCESSAQGETGEAIAELISEAREDTDDVRKGSNPVDRAADEAANQQGRDAGGNARNARKHPIKPQEAEKICRAACDVLKPKPKLDK